MARNNAPADPARMAAIGRLICAAFFRGVGKVRVDPFASLRRSAPCTVKAAAISRCSRRVDYAVSSLAM